MFKAPVAESMNKFFIYITIVISLLYLLVWAKSQEMSQEYSQESSKENRIVSQKQHDEDHIADNEVPAALPLPGESGSDRVHKIELGSTPVAMEHLGPIIVNTDGTTRRIANWDTMTEAEQANAIRLISARNKRRIEALLEQKGERASSQAQISTDEVGEN